MTRKSVYLFLACTLFTLQSQAQAVWRAQWVWSTEPGQTDVYLRIPFELSSPATDARLVVTADNNYRFYVNGKKIGQDYNWMTLEEYEFSSHLQVGKNVIALHGGDDGGGAAGLMLEGIIRMENGKAVVVATGPNNRVSLAEETGWTQPEFDDSEWSEPWIQGPVGMFPWHDFNRPRWFAVRGQILSSDWIGSTLPGETGTPKLEMILDGPLPAQEKVNLVFQLGGEDVWTISANVDLPVIEWPINEPFTVQFSGFGIPIWMPRCELTFAPRIADLTVDGIAPVWIGERLPAAPEVRTEVRGVTLSEDGRNLDLEITCTASGPLESGLRYVVCLYRERELWFADSPLPGTDTGTWKPQTPHEETLTIPLPPLPRGDYRIDVGIHRTRTAEKPDASLSLIQKTGTYERPYGYGTFVDKFGTPHFWYINPWNAMVWDGEPYVPVGGMYLPRWSSKNSGTSHFEGDIEALTEIRNYGVTDLYFNPCRNALEDPAYVWQSMMDIAEEVGMEYCWDFPMHVDELRAYHIESRDYTVPVDETGKARVFVPWSYFGRTDANNRVLYSAFQTERDELLEMGYARAFSSRDGIYVEVTVQTAERENVVVHFIPELTYWGDMHDYWAAVTDQYIWKIKKMLERLKPGPRFRGFIDPLANEQSFRDQQRMLPSGHAFRSQFALWLVERYGSMEQLVQAWAIEPAPSFFNEAAGLVPLGTANRDSAKGYAFSVDSERIFRIDLPNSQMWDDMMQFRDDSIRDFNNQLADVVKSVIDAPVIMKLTELHSFTNDQTVGGFDAVGNEAYGDAPELVRGCGGGVYARSAQAKRTIWMLVTETGFARTDITPVGYPDPLRLIYELTSQVEYGARGTYYFVFIPGGGWTIFNLFEDKRQFGWMGAYSTIMKQSRDLPYHRPWVDFSFPQKQVGPTGFRRPDPDFHGTPPHVSVPTKNNKWVVPVVDIPPIDPIESRARLIVNLEDTPASTRYAATFEQAIEIGWPIVMVGLRKDLGILSVDVYYTDRFEVDADSRVVQILNPPANAEITHRLADGRPFGFSIEGLSIIAKDDWDFVVRGLDGYPRHGCPDRFTEEVLNAEFVDLGPAIQAIRTGEVTFIWNLGEEDHSIRINSSEPMRIVTVDTGEILSDLLTCDLTLVASAENTIRIETPGALAFGNLDGINRSYLMTKWNRLEKMAEELGLDFDPFPSELRWQEIASRFADLETTLTDISVTAIVKPVSGIVVDGNLDDWRDIPEILITNRKHHDFVEDIRPLEETGVRLGYSEKGLYLAVRVRDEHIINNHRGTNIWNGDSFELFLEARLDPGRMDRAYTSDTYQFIFAPTTADGRPDLRVVGNPKLPEGHVPEHVKWVSGRTANGWTIEAFFPPEALFGWSPRSGETIGFSFALNDSDGGDRDQVYPWQKSTNMSWHRLMFGRARFVE